MNELFETSTGIPASTVVGKNVSSLIPNLVVEYHDRFISNYLNRFDGPPTALHFTRVWLRRQDFDTVLPVKIQLLSCISQTHGLLLVGLVESADPVSFGNITYKINQSFILLADEKGIITNTSPNFIRYYFN